MVVATGQQAGTFGGPIFTLLKALTAIKLARDVERTHDVPAVAVFWVDAEDHDWNEVASCTVLDAELAPKPVRRRPRAAARGRVRSPTSRSRQAPPPRRSPPSSDALPPTEFTEPLLASLPAHYRDGVTLARAFAGLMDTLLGPLGLVVYDAADPATKAARGRALRARAVELPGETSRLAARPAPRSRPRGYKAQVTPAAGRRRRCSPSARRASRSSARRRRLLRSATARCRAADLAVDAATHPERFSPNVLLRPLVQDTLFPTVAYVGGPSEIAYFAQLKDVYAHFGLPMPLVVPRATATFVDGAGAALPASARASSSARSSRATTARSTGCSSRRCRARSKTPFQRRAPTSTARMAAVIAAVPAVDATLEGAAQSTLGKMTHELTALQQKVVQAAKRRDDTLRRQFERARALAFPGGEPQERAVGLSSAAEPRRPGPGRDPRPRAARRPRARRCPPSSTGWSQL